MTNFLITGIDVYSWQCESTWQQDFSQGITFAFIKATEGTKVINGQFLHNIQETDRFGIPRVVYHYFKADKDGKKQVDPFASIINDRNFELEPVMDLETDASITKNDLNNICAKWIPQVEEAAGRDIMIYYQYRISMFNS